MRPHRLLLSAYALSTALAGPASAEIYRWTDRNGVDHFTSDINQVPASQRDLARASTSAGKGTLQRIQSVKGAPATASGGAASAPRSSRSRPAPAAQAEEERIEGRTEAEWRGAAADHRTQIALLEEQAEACKDDEFRWSYGAGQREYDEEVAEAEACRRANADLRTQRTQLERLEDEAHRAGVPPGWLRE